jgi:glycosyltransferase involved in cell wall biosynthesis
VRSGGAGDVKICHYVREVRLELGGVVRAVLDFTGGLAAAGQDVTLITTYDEDATWEQDGPKPRVVRVGPTSARGGRFPRAELERIRPIIAEADVLHLHGVWLSSNVQLARIAREVGTPYVWSTHGVLDDWSMSQRRLKKRLFLALWGRRALEQAAFVVCTGSAVDRVGQDACAAAHHGHGSVRIASRPGPGAPVLSRRGLGSAGPALSEPAELQEGGGSAA